MKAKVAGARPGTVTTMPPTDAAVAVEGTLVVMTVPVLPVTPAARPPTVTVAPDILAPLMTIGVLGWPLDGETLDMLGGDATVPVHPTVLILMVPAPNITVAVGQGAAAPLTNILCAWAVVTARPAKTNVAVIKLCVREKIFI